MVDRDHILRAMADVLRPNGFGRHASSFHRQKSDGFIETITLQAGVGRLSGQSTVNLGVYIPEVAVLFGEEESVDKARAKKYPKEYECALRMRLSRLAFGDDRWFDRSASGIENEISSLLTSCALPYFAQFSSLPAIAERVRSGRLPNSVAGPGLQAAVFYLIGDQKEARLVLLRWHKDNPALIGRIAQAMGIRL